MTPRWKIRREDDPEYEGFRVWRVYDGGTPKDYFYIWENAIAYTEIR